MLVKDGENNQGYVFPEDLSNEEKPVEAIKPVPVGTPMDESTSFNKPIQPAPSLNSSQNNIPIRNGSSLPPQTILPPGEARPQTGQPINVNKNINFPKNSQPSSYDDKSEIETSIDENGLGTPGMLAILILSISILTTGLFYGMVVGKNSVLKAKQTQLSDLESTLASTELASVDKTSQNMKKQIDAITQASQSQTYFSNLLTELQIVTEKGVKLDSFSTDDKKAVTMGGTATNFVDLAKFIVSLNQSTRFANSRLATLGKGEGGVITFTISSELTAKALGK